ncbi:MAG: hypothetical protein WC222_00330 [Parachlamydiales bacterium]
MAKVKLEDEIARLESENDYLLTEIASLNTLMQKVGFSEGIKTVKATAREMLKQEHNTQNFDEYEE